MRRPIVTTLLATLLATVSLGSDVAFAQSDADRAAARALGQEGQEALEKKDYAVALDKFTRADKIYRAPTLMLGLARAQAGTGKLVAAFETYTRLARDPLPSNPSAAFKKAQEDGKRELAALESRVPSVVINVTGPNDPSVTIDGEAVPAALLGAKRPVDPGNHRVSATASGYAPVETTFQAVEGGTANVGLAMKKSEAPAAAVAPVEPKQPPATPVPRTQPEASQAPIAKSPAPRAGLTNTQIGAIVAGGLGVVALIGGTVVQVGARSKNDGARNSGCRPDGTYCTTDALSQHDDAKSQQSVATILFVAGGALAAGGTALFFFGGPGDAKTSLSVSPFGVMARGAF